MGTSAACFPLTALVTAITLPSQTENKRRCALSMARPEGLLHPGSGQVLLTVSFCVSMTTICPGSLSMLTKIWPRPSCAANSGLSGTGMVATTARLDASSTVTSFDAPLKVNTCLPEGSI